MWKEKCLHGLLGKGISHIGLILQGTKDRKTTTSYQTF